MTINNRFSEIINVLYGGNKAAFAEAIDVAPTVIQNVVGTRQGKPSFEVIAKVCALANINTEWVISGKGEMIVSDESVEPSQTKSMDMTDRLIEKIGKQAEEIGRLKERNAQLERENATMHDELSRGLPPQEAAAQVYTHTHETHQI